MDHIERADGFDEGADETAVGRMNRRRLLQLGAGLAGAAALAACKKSEPSSTSASASSTTVSATESSTVTSATTAASSTSAAATTTATSAPALAADRTAILRFGAMRGTSYDPMRVGTQTEYPQLNVIYDTLISIDPTNSEFLPRLATKWEPQGDRLRLTLRTGVTFQDGTPLDAEAVKFSMDRARTDPESTISARMTNIVSVDVVDASTVDIVLKTPEFLPLLILLADRPGMIVSPTAVKAAGNSEAFSKAPIGAGMYKVTGEWLPREKMSVRAWDGYWDKEAAALGGIDFSEIAMAAALNALRADEVDMGSYQGADAQTIENDKALRLKVGYAPLIKGLVINITKAPFDNVKVRQAISYAIDREAAVKALTFGYGRPAYQMFAQESLGYDPALEGFYKYDPEKAKALLAEAGFPDGVSFDSIIGSTSAPYVQFGQFLQANLKKANITMNLSLEDPSTVIPRLYAEGSAASAPIATSGAVVDTTIRLSLLAGGPTNASKLETPGVKELVDKAALAKTVEEARTYYQQISRIQVEGVYSIIPVFNEPALLGYHNYVGDVTRGFTDVDASPEMFRGIFITEGKQPAS